MMDNVNSKVVIARKGHNKDGMLGVIIPIFEIEDKVISPITEHNFCPTLRVFIKSNYDEIDNKFGDGEFFKIPVLESDRGGPVTDTGKVHCKFVASGRDAERIKAKDYIQVIVHPLPEVNSRFLYLEDTLPGTQYIFIEDEGFLFGPFKWSSVDKNKLENHIKIEFIDSQLPYVSLAPYQVYKIDLSDSDIEESVTTAVRADVKIINDLSILNFHNAISYEDYASDDEIIRYCAKIAHDLNFKFIDKKQVDMTVSALSKNPKFKGEMFRNRLVKFSEVHKEVFELKKNVLDSLSGFFNTENGKSIISDYIQDNEDVYLGKIKKDKEKEIKEFIQSKSAEINDVKERIKVLNDTKSSLSLEVEKKREEVNSDEHLQAAYHDKDKLLHDKITEIKEKEKYLDDMKPLIKGCLSIDNLKREKDYLERSNQETKEKVDRLREELQGLKNESEMAEDKLRKRLNDMRPYVDHITGGYQGDSSAEQRAIQVEANSLSLSSSLVERQKIVIDSIQENMLRDGRSIEDWQVANLLISTQQSFITFLAGLPGVGKTSLARLFFHAQNLKLRSQEVSVARGWTGQKDLIGYYNPLASRFQTSNTGLYSFIRSLDAEKSENNSAMAYVLLDEANLSPIEHYWSCFMGMTDDIENRELILGDEQIHIKKNLRFISTINYDGTTEPLSHRVVDRAPIMVLESSATNGVEASSIEDVMSCALPLDMKNMDDLFGCESNVPNFENGELDIFNKIKNILMEQDPTLGRPVSISPRKEIAIRQFCSKGRAIMREYHDYRALDIATLQHILPLIRGNGAGFSKRISKLKVELERVELDLSAKYLSQVIIYGEEDLHTYDFFCW